MQVHLKNMTFVLFDHRLIGTAKLKQHLPISSLVKLITITIYCKKYLSIFISRSVSSESLTEIEQIMRVHYDMNQLTEE